MKVILEDYLTLKRDGKKFMMMRQTFFKCRLRLTSKMILISLRIFFFIITTFSFSFSLAIHFCHFFCVFLQVFVGIRSLQNHHVNQINPRLFCFYSQNVVVKSTFSQASLEKKKTMFYFPLSFIHAHLSAGERREESVFVRMIIFLLVFV